MFKFFKKTDKDAIIANLKAQWELANIQIKDLEKKCEFNGNYKLAYENIKKNDTMIETYLKMLNEQKGKSLTITVKAYDLASIKIEMQ